MKLSDLLPDPRQALKPWEIFKSREGQPFVQSVMRNLGHNAFGETIGNAVDQRFLGDAAPGQLSPVAGMAAGMQPTAALQPLPEQPSPLKQKGGGFAQLLQQALKAKQGGM